MSLESAPRKKLVHKVKNYLADVGLAYITYGDPLHSLPSLFVKGKGIRGVEPVSRMAKEVVGVILENRTRQAPYVRSFNMHQKRQVHFDGPLPGGLVSVNDVLRLMLNKARGVNCRVVISKGAGADKGKTYVTVLPY